MRKCKHDLVKMITEVHGDIWICLNDDCDYISKEGVFTEEEREIMVEYLKVLKERV